MIASSARLFGMAGISTGDAVIGCWDNKAYYSNSAPDHRDLARLKATTETPATAPADGWPRVCCPRRRIGRVVRVQLLHGGHDVQRGELLRDGQVHVHHAQHDVKHRPDVHAVQPRPRDTVDARIYQGLHFRTADKAGAWLGKKVANWVDKHEFGPRRLTPTRHLG